MKANNNSPAIRFAGFTAPWERRKLKDYLVRYDNLRIPVSSSKRVPGPTPYYGANGIQDYVEGYTHDGQFILVAEDGANDLKNYPVQYVFGKVWVNNHAHVLQAIESIADNLFFKYSISQTDIEPFLVGGGRAKLNAETMMNIETLAPMKAEQVSIGLMLGRLDNLITYHQRKYEKLLNLKKAMLDKMFPKNGELVPAVRFSGFSSNWERRRIEELLVERNQQFPKSAEYPLMAFIAEEGVSPKGDRYDRSALVNDAENKLYKRTEFGDFIYSSNNLETGSIGLNKFGRACISPVYSIFYPTDLANSNFLGCRLVMPDFINEMVRWRQGVIYGQWRIHESDFFKISIIVPNLEEQGKIGDFFCSLDNAIRVYRCKTNLLQNLKSAFLEKMFV